MLEAAADPEVVALVDQAFMAIYTICTYGADRLSEFQLSQCETLAPLGEWLEANGCFWDDSAGHFLCGVEP